MFQFFILSHIRSKKMNHCLIKKHCLIKVGKYVYCTKCGQRITQDTYNCNKHKKICHFSKKDCSNFIIPKQDFFYEFSIKNEKLYFYVYQLSPILTATDDSILSSKYSPIFIAWFDKPTASFREWGRFHVNTWFDTYLDNNRMICLNQENPKAIISSLFPEFTSQNTFSDLLSYTPNQVCPLNKIAPLQTTENGVVFDSCYFNTNVYHYAYLFQIQSEKLHFYVYDVKYKKSLRAWNRPIFHAIFEKNSNQITQDGIKTLDEWFDEMDNSSYFFCLNRTPVKTVFHQMYPCIFDFSDFRMFLKLYRNKRFIQPQKEITALIRKPLSFEQCHYLNQNLNSIWIDLITLEEKLYLHLILHINDSFSHIVLSDDSCIVSPNETVLKSKNWFCDFNMRAVLLTMNHIQYVTEEIFQFYDAYPQLHIKSYLKSGGIQPLLVLLIPYFHTGLELLAKSGLGDLADCLFYQKFLIGDYINYNPYANNHKEMFGIPFSLLCRIEECRKKYDGNNHMNTTNYINYIRALQFWYHEFPQILDFPVYHESYLHFLSDYSTNIRYSNYYYSEVPSPYYSLLHTTNQSLEDVFLTARYLNQAENGSFNFYEKYVSYLNKYVYVHKYIKDTPYKKRPKNFKEMNKKLYDCYETLKLDEKYPDFLSRVNSPKYLALSSESIGESGALENYLIVTPKKPSELTQEGISLHNCVGSYISMVSKGTCIILFLREKTNPQKSFAAIELSGNAKYLKQLKTINNRRVCDEAQEYVKKWCECKGIKIKTSDISLKDKK